MIQDYTVAVEMRDFYGNKTGENVYTLRDYATMLSWDIKRTLMEVENTIKDMQGGKRKQEWTPEVKNAFGKIRHRLLDEANAVERLPSTMRKDGRSLMEETSGETIAAIVNSTHNETSGETIAGMIAEMTNNM